MKKYDMSLDRANNELKVKVWGMYETDDANSFVSHFTKITSTIKAFEFVLRLNAEELKVSNNIN